MFMVGCSLSAIVMQFLTYLRLAGHLAREEIGRLVGSENITAAPFLD
jgi:hypothetical protein